MQCMSETRFHPSCEPFMFFTIIDASFCKFYCWQDSRYNATRNQKKMRTLIHVVSLLLLIWTVQGFYLPGVPTKFYNQNSVVPVKTRKLSSVHNLPYDFYSLKYCRPIPLRPSAENLGEYLFGDRIENSVYNVRLSSLASMTNTHTHIV